MKKFLFISAILMWIGIGAGSLNAQILNVSPVFPTVDDTVEIIYNAAEGNGALVGITPVHAHAGVITASSNSPTDWQYVATQWGSSDGLMEDIGNNLHRIRYHIRSYYGIPQSEDVDSLSFVFRDAAGNVVGRSEAGTDIYYPVYDAGVLYAAILTPNAVEIVNANDNVDISGASSEDADLTLRINGGDVANETSAKEISYNFSSATPGTYEVVLVADNGTDVTNDTSLIVVRGAVTQAALPTGVEDGINYIDGQTTTLVLYAPDKDFIYVLGDFNDWTPDPAYYMNRTPDGLRWWVQIDNLNPGEEYAFQYLIDGNLYVADPYTEKVLDPFNDPFLGGVYPNLKPYPAGANGIVSILQTEKPGYTWQNPTYTRPANEDLVIYELLVRDFLADHSYTSLIDSLDYLQNMGVNCIELMPIMEFEGNISWGYNPSYFFAVDKYYGTENDLRAFIDSCHGRGIVVLLDMVLNHAFGQSPMVQMYWDGNRPSANSPWFNQEATHPFNVGFDFNHESEATKYFVDRVLAYWVEEFKFDGYRMDLSKGFTQVNNPNDVGAWSAYDASRIALLKRMYDELLAVDPGVYFTLEHLGDNVEEKELAEYGMMLWSKLTEPYNEATMGYNTGSKSDFSWIDYRQRNWNVKHNITYMESHDEQRLMYKNFEFGAGNADYSAKDLRRALQRVEAAAAFFYPIPGPRMLWQFGELGYEVDIDFNGRTGPKPIRWEYLQDSIRKDLYDAFGAMIKLRELHPVFKTTDFTLEVRPAVKRVYLRAEGGDNMEVFILGNFDIVPQEIVPGFSSTGMWYDFFSGDSLNVTDVNASATLAPGEYFIYSNEPLPTPDERRPFRNIFETFTSIETPVLAPASVRVAPNPSSGQLTLEFGMERAGFARVELMDLQGRSLNVMQEGFLNAGPQELNWQADDSLSNGLYIIRISTEAELKTLKWQLAR